jgi:hypothetical protein
MAEYFDHFNRCDDCNESESLAAGTKNGSRLHLFDHSMTEADAEHGFAFVAFDHSIYGLALLVASLSAKVRCVDSWLFARCELMPYPSIISGHALNHH